ncbi:MAG TPA: hypothetical protein VMW27_17565 [Thermoanaerobaculia bacterium]|nr:hypothetical protein [Thermoanaerobaculia bacterium]
MRKNANNQRILGRRLAREMSRVEHDRAFGDPDTRACSTTTFRFPPDCDDPGNEASGM